MSAQDGKTGSNSTATYDIGAFIVKYQRLVELLLPLILTWKSVLYIVRWENYFLTLLMLAASSCLFYLPVTLLFLLVLIAIVLMAVGRYYSQSRQLFLLKCKETPKPSVLQQDHQNMKQYYKEQKESHKQLMEYKNILENAEKVLSKALNSLEHVYSVILWQSPEVSLCVSVLLCVFLVLLCTVSLRSLLATLPALALCSNTHFLHRTVSLWKGFCSFVYRKAKLKRREKEVPPLPPEAEAPPTSEPAETSHRTPTASSFTAPLQDHSTESVPVSSAASSDSEDTGRPVQRSRVTIQAVQPPATGSSDAGAEPTRGSPKPPMLSRKDMQGFCSKCNTSFAKLLKRKHDCNYCGQSYCGSCTVKVKKALLGATSPAAFEESVRVCMECKLKLDTINSSRPS